MKDFCYIYYRQIDFQQKLVDTGMYGDVDANLPKDKLDIFSYHMQAMISELGEVLEADKRWKNYRNDKYSREKKLEEIADCFITLMNVSIFSGYQSYELENAIVEKISKNVERHKHIIDVNMKLDEQYKIAEEWGNL